MHAARISIAFRVEYRSQINFELSLWLLGWRQWSASVISEGYNLRLLLRKALISAAIKGLFTNFLAFVCLPTPQWPIVTFFRGFSPRSIPFVCKTCRRSSSFVRTPNTFVTRFHSNLFARSWIPIKNFSSHSQVLEIRIQLCCWFWQRIRTENIWLRCVIGFEWTLDAATLLYLITHRQTNSTCARGFCMSCVWLSAITKNTKISSHFALEIYRKKHSSTRLFSIKQPLTCRQTNTLNGSRQTQLRESINNEIVYANKKKTMRNSAEKNVLKLISLQSSDD